MPCKGGDKKTGGVKFLLEEQAKSFAACGKEKAFLFHLLGQEKTDLFLKEWSRLLGGSVRLPGRPVMKKAIQHTHHHLALCHKEMSTSGFDYVWGGLQSPAMQNEQSLQGDGTARHVGLFRTQDNCLPSV